MKLVIDIPDEYVEQIKNNTEGATAESEAVDAIRNGIPYENQPQGDLISRDALKKAICDKGIKAICEKGIKGYEEYNQGLATALDLIDLAQPASDRYEEGYAQGYIDGSTGADWKGEDE